MIQFLNAGRNIANTLSYTPKTGVGARTMNLVRSNTTLGGKIRPLILHDPDFWPLADYLKIVAEIGEKPNRDWESTNVTKAMAGVSTLGQTAWDTLRGKKYKGTVMVGAMVAALEYCNMKDFVVSAAPNILYKAPKSAKEGDGYKPHLVKGDNTGEQIHTEMIFAAQLQSLFTAMKDATEIPRGQQIAVPGLSKGIASADVDILIEKSSLCPGCTGTWQQFDAWMTGEKHPLTYRMI